MKKFALAGLLSLMAGSAMAADCSVVVESNDQMQYNKQEIVVSKACSTVEVELKHVGALPKAVMGHNIVITKSDDMTPVVTESMAAGPANDYLKAGDARILAHSSLIGGGESSKFSIDTSKFEKGGAYSFFCTYPGHMALMKGTVKVTD